MNYCNGFRSRVFDPLDDSGRAFEALKRMCIPLYAKR